LGLVVDPFFDDASDSVRTATQAAAHRLSAAGANVDNARLPDAFAEVTAMHRRMMGVEAAEYHQSMFREQGHRYGPNIASLIKEGFAANALDYSSALVHRRQLQRDMLTSFAEFDAMVTPATTTPAPGIVPTGDPKFNSPWSYVGYPTVSVPCALAEDGLPVSLQLVGRPFDEARLFAAAAWCERVVAFDRLPKLLAELEPQ
jgi:aspartyl-tRNA(Asn)/glutamyl-tRNA(Gln) amidotransferase subunit A